MPKVSVIVPIYNVEQYIEKCARSLFEQSLDDMEFIFVDDCTPDNSIEILKNVIEEYPMRKSEIRILQHRRNKGNSSARNTGLECANGVFIAYCDSDDWVDPMMYEKLYQRALEDKADVVYCDFNMINKHYYVREKVGDFHNDKIILMRNYISSIWTTLWTMMAKRELYLQYNLEVPRHITYCEDFWLAVRLLHYAKRISYMPCALYNYNCNNTQSIVHTLSLKTEKEEQTAYLETIAFFEKECVMEHYQKQMGWRILKSKQEMVLDAERHKEFMTIYPESHKYIPNCPYINVKQKIMMWLLTHNLRFILLPILYLRKQIGH